MPNCVSTEDLKAVAETGKGHVLTISAIANELMRARNKLAELKNASVVVIGKTADP